LEEQDSQQERQIAARSVPAELLRMQTGLARLSSEVQTTLPQLRASSEAGQMQFSREVEQLRIEISGLQALAADHVCRRDVEMVRQEAKADAAALRSEVG
jgi:hypothetical protein